MFDTLFGIKKHLQNFEKEIIAKQDRLTNLELKISFTEQAVRTAEQKLAAIKNDVITAEHQRTLDKYNALGANPASLDFDAMNAFSVERNFSTKVAGLPITIVGYLVDKTVKEWVLYIDDAQHKALVIEFNNYVKNKKQV
jgi:hypothetical protein